MSYREKPETETPKPDYQPPPQGKHIWPEGHRGVYHCPPPPSPEERQKTIIFAIDPGPTESAYVIAATDMKPIKKGKVPNETMLELIQSEWYTDMVIEMIASYGMAVGAEVFETCVWIGRFMQNSYVWTRTNVTRIPRKDIKLHLCGTTKAKDANIRQALIDRFGVVGTKGKPGWFFGFKSDLWSAMAVLCTYVDTVHVDERAR